MQNKIEQRTFVSRLLSFYINVVENVLYLYFSVVLIHLGCVKHVRIQIRKENKLQLCGVMHLMVTLINHAII